MKILCTADLHINDWIPFSEIDEFGRPSRLTDYLKLAEVIQQLAHKENCTAIQIAGDISEASTQRPRVHDIIGDFLRIASMVTPIYLIHGQHDCDSKEAKAMGENSILKEICKDLEDVFYYPEPTLVQLQDKSVWFQPWTHGHELEGPDADIFIGHGIVKGCSTLDGYIFMNGFEVEELTSKYSISVIGDIHKRQIYRNPLNGNIVLQPGAPIQNTWKDHADCGLYIVDTDTKEAKFYSIHDLAPDTFHQFVYDQESTDLIHSRPKIKLPKKDKISKSLEIKRDNTVIYETCTKLISEEDNLKNPGLISKYLNEVFENTSLANDKVISKTTILYVKAKNFLSINELELDFEEFPKSCVIVGHNGSGKTTLPEAIYWCLTGNTTKSTPISEIPSTFNEGSCEVSVRLLINNQEFTITRVRENSSLTIFKSDGSTIRLGSIRETQAEIYKLLGLQEWQILMFSYFCAEKPSLFEGLGETNKADLTGQIVGLDFVEAMRAYAKKKKNKVKDERLVLEGDISRLKLMTDQATVKLKKLQSQTEDNKPKIEAEITNLNNQAALLEESLSELEDKFIAKYTQTYLDTDPDTEALSKKYYELQSTYETTRAKKVLLESNLNRNKKDYKDATSGVCPTCNQALHDKTLINKLKEDIVKDFRVIKELPNLEELETDLKKLHSKLEGFQKISKAKSLYLKSVKENQDKLSKIPLKISELEKQLIVQEADNRAILEAEVALKNYETELEQAYSSSINFTDQQNSWDYLETKLFKRNGNLVKELNKQGSKLIQHCINEILQGLNIVVSIDTDLNLSGTFNFAKKVKYKGMSSGQKRVTDIVMMVALNNLFSKIYNLEDGVLGLAIYDEILSFLDEKYIDVAKNIVDQSISKKLLVVTHDTKLMNMYDSKIKVSLTNTGSNYIKSWK